MAQTGTGDQFHDHERPALVLARVVDRDDVRMIERGGDLGLAKQARSCVVTERAFGQHLDRDGAAEAQILASIHHAHTAPAEHVVEPVPAAESYGIAGLREFDLPGMQVILGGGHPGRVPFPGGPPTEG